MMEDTFSVKGVLPVANGGTNVWTARNMTAYRVEVETCNTMANKTEPCDGKQDLDCLDGVVIVVTDDPAMIMRTFRVKKLEKLGPGYVLEREP